MTTMLEINALFDQAVEEYRASSARRSIEELPGAKRATPENVIATVFSMLATFWRAPNADTRAIEAMLRSLELAPATLEAILALDHTSEEFQAFAHELFHPRN